MPDPEKLKLFRMKALELLGDPKITNADKEKVIEKMRQLGMPLESDVIEASISPMSSEPDPGDVVSMPPPDSEAWMPDAARNMEKNIIQRRREGEASAAQIRKQRAAEGAEDPAQTLMRSTVNAMGAGMVDEAKGFGAGVAAGVEAGRPVPEPSFLEHALGSIPVLGPGLKAIMAGGRAIDYATAPDETPKVSRGVGGQPTGETSYTQARDAERAAQAKGKKDNPAEDLIGLGLGTIPQMFFPSPALRAAPEVAPGVGAVRGIMQQLPTRLGNAAKVGAFPGAPVMAAQGFGESTAPDAAGQRMDAAMGGAMGLLTPLAVELGLTPIRIAGRGAWNMMTSSATPEASARRMAEAAGAKPVVGGLGRRGLAPGERISAAEREVVAENARAASEGRIPEAIEASDVAGKRAAEKVVPALKKYHDRSIGEMHAEVERFYDSPAGQKQVPIDDIEAKAASELEGMVADMGDQTEAVQSLLEARGSELAVPERAKGTIPPPGRKGKVPKKAAEEGTPTSRDLRPPRLPSLSTMAPSEPPPPMTAEAEDMAVRYVPGSPHEVAKKILREVQDLTLDARHLDDAIRNWRAKSGAYKTPEGKYTDPAGRLYDRMAAVATEFRDRMYPELAALKKVESQRLDEMHNVLELFGLPRDIKKVQTDELSPSWDKVFTTIEKLTAGGNVSERRAINKVLQENPAALKDLITAMGIKGYEKLTQGIGTHGFLSPFTGRLGITASGGDFGGPVGGRIGNRIAGLQNIGETPHRLTTATFAHKADLLHRLYQAYKGEKQP